PHLDAVRTLGAALAHGPDEVVIYDARFHVLVAERWLVHLDDLSVIDAPGRLAGATVNGVAGDVPRRARLPRAHHGTGFGLDRQPGRRLWRRVGIRFGIAVGPDLLLAVGA